jgi:flagellar biosynthesis protein FlhF
MQVKTYRGPNNHSVMEMIKADIGPEAVILGMKNYKEDGRAMCEVTAALEQTSPAGSPDLDALCVGKADWGDWQGEWARIREHLLLLMKPHMDMERLVPRQRLALEYLEREGVEGDVVMNLFKALSRNPEASVLEPLGKIVQAIGWGEDSWPEKFHAVAGPHGVGKTTTVLRLAMALKHKNPELRLCMVNADGERGGGRLLLKHYAELSDMTYFEADGAKGMAKLARVSAGYDKVLIDLPACERGSTLESLTDRLGLESCGEVRIHLALSPFFASEQFSALVRKYRSPLVGSLIWTKLDEACTFGALVNLGVTTGLPVSALSFGPGLRDTLVSAEAVALWRLLFKHEIPGGSDRDAGRPPRGQ